MPPNCASIPVNIRVTRYTLSQSLVQATKPSYWASKLIERETSTLSLPHHPQIIALRLNAAYPFDIYSFATFLHRARLSQGLQSATNLLKVDGGVEVWPQKSGGMGKSRVLRAWVRRRGLRSWTTAAVQDGA